MLNSKFYAIDAHCHVQFPIYDNDREVVIGRAREAGVKMIAAGSQISTSEAAIGLAHKYPEDIWATVGFHPSHAVIDGWHHDKNEQKGAEPEKFDIKKIKELAMDSKVVGIGECGLDYYRLVESEKLKAKRAQKDVFGKMVDLAAELKKPLVVHCRPSSVKTSADAQALVDKSEGKALNSDDAYLDLLEMLENRNDLEFKVLHCFSGGLEIAKKLAEAGFYFTLGGAVTFPSKTDKKKCAYDDVINYLPLDRIMTETDCPYIAPVPYRGSRNEPAYVIETAKKIAEIKNISIDEFKEAVCRNAGRVFGISI